MLPTIIIGALALAILWPFIKLGYELIKRIESMLEDDAVFEQSPQMAGRNLSVTIRSK